MPFYMIRNDITKMRVDAIVNPSNCALQEGRGTSRAVFQAAGRKKLARACEEIGFCEEGKAVLTKGFFLSAKYIIHAVCPQWQGGKQHEAEKLFSAYHQSLELAKKWNLQSVAFPLLSSGFYGYPKKEAMETAVSAISQFLLHEGMEENMAVYLVLYDHESVEISHELHQAVQEYIDDHYVAEAESAANFSETVPSEDVGLLVDTMDDCITMDHDFAEDLLYEEYEDEKEIEEKSDSGQYRAKPWEQQESNHDSRVHPVGQPENRTDFTEFLRKQTQIKHAFREPEQKLHELLNHMDETFSQMLLRLIDERGMKDSYVYRKANIDRRLFSKIRNNINYAPTKKTVLAFAIALELSLDETKDLLLKAGYALSNSVQFDVIVSFFIENRHYNIFEINEVLFAFRQPILGE